MIRVSTVLVAMALAITPAHAVGSDPRLAIVTYDPSRVFPVRGRVGYQSMIEFGEGEKIENVAVGDSADWQVTPNRRANLLFFKPLKANAKTNMTVVTDRRVYLFDLSVAAIGQPPTYTLRFHYGGEPSPASSGTSDSSSAVDDVAPATTAVSAPRPQEFNFDWKANGKKDLLPVRVFDDGLSLYLMWSSGTPLPALLVRGADGTETPVNSRQSGAFVVVDQVPSMLVLRHGKRTATLVRNRSSGNRGHGR